MSYIGTNKIGKMHLGNTAIGKAYLGNDLVYSSDGGIAPVLTYDAELDYLQSSGTQYIETGIIPTNTTGIKIVFDLVEVRDAFIVGCRINASNTRWSIGSSTSRYYGGYGTVYGGFPPYPSVGVLTECSLNYLNDGVFIVDNSAGHKETSLSALQFTPTHNIRLFGSAGITGSYTVWSGKMYSVKISQNSGIVMDLIPVRVGQVGYMYDKVSGQLFGNNGTGSFILGNDKTT